MGKRRLSSSKKEINQLSLAEELALEERRNVVRFEDESTVKVNTETGVDGEVHVEDQVELVEVKRKRSVGEDLLDTLDVVVRLLQSVADQLSLATGKPSTGSNVNSLNELSWETAAFEKEIRDRIQWLGDKMSSIRIPRIISQLMDFGREYARENPVTALVLLALCLTSSAPVLMFLVFAVATILITFLGFLFVEGTLLTVATVIFGGVILIVGFITLSAVLVGMLGYFTTNQAYLVLTGRSRIYRLLRKLPIIGKFFPNPPSDSEQVLIQQRFSSSASATSAFIPNGKIGNGYGHAEKNHFYVVDDEDEDDMHDILETDDDEDLEEDIAGELVSPSTTTSANTPVVAQQEQEEIILRQEEEEDLPNQEIISNKSDEEEEEEKVVEEEGKIQFVDCAKANGSSGEEKVTPCIQLNGHHHENGNSSEEDKVPVNVESLA